MADAPFTQQQMRVGHGVIGQPPVSSEDAAVARAPPGLVLSQRPAPPAEPPPRPPAGPPPPPPLGASGLGERPMVLGLLGPNAPVAVHAQPQRSVGPFVDNAKLQQDGGKGLGKGEGVISDQDQEIEHMHRNPSRQQQNFSVKVGAPSRRMPDGPPIGQNSSESNQPAANANAQADNELIANSDDSLHGGKMNEDDGGWETGGAAAAIPREHAQANAAQTADARDAWDSPTAETYGQNSDKSARTETAAPAARSPGSNLSRSELIRAVFKACDADEDGWLSEREAYTFASVFGYGGSELQWAQEFHKLCEEKKANLAKGITLNIFTLLVNDKSTGGLHSSDGELKLMLKEIEALKDGTGRSGDLKSRSSPGREGYGYSDRRGNRATEELGEGDEFYAKLKRTVNWYNKHGGLAEPIRLSEVNEVLAEIKPGQAMKILYDLDVVKETVADPTGWVIAEGRKRKQLNDAPPPNEKRENFRKNSAPAGEKDQGANSTRGDRSSFGTSNIGNQVAEGERRGYGQGYQNRSDGQSNKGSGKGKGKAAADQEPEQVEGEDEFRSKMRRTINWYNRHGGLLAPIRVNDVLSTLATDHRIGMRILNDLDQANAEGVLNDPTKWILEEHRRRILQGDKGATPSSNASAARAATTTEQPLPKPGALSKLGGLTAMPVRLGPPKKAPETP